ncbi:uncharacterized protein LOC107270745 isoform X2 [Cephus cinctus]|uniref:Uncharacterized protein LOC107270745 isoform X2 n=1 Tax=Cephus cinctus TaxID=211228 RepID=A0AAJ7C556_CEPCN|nr:uncharacterized protein LOC107270745 isoform X2 [Cephus cinctus]
MVDCRLIMGCAVARMPFHQFNPFTGRLKQTNHLQPLYPLAPHPLEKAEPPKMLWDSMLTKPAKVGPSVGVARFSKVDPKLLAKYKKFQEPNGIPVYLKGGPMDKVLVGLTFGLIAVGLVQFAEFVYKEANGIKWEK